MGGQKPNTTPIQEPIITQIYDLNKLKTFQDTISSIDIFQKIIYMIKNNYLNKDFKTQSRNDPTNIPTANYKSFINNCSGGIIGYIFNGSINNCIVNGHIIGDHSGGIVSQACTLPKNKNYTIPYTIPLLVNITNCKINGKLDNDKTKTSGQTSGHILGDNSGNSSNNKFCKEITYDNDNKLDNNDNFLFVIKDNRREEVQNDNYPLLIYNEGCYSGLDNCTLINNNNEWNRNLVTVKNCTSQFENINSINYECSTLFEITNELYTNGTKPVGTNIISDITQNIINNPTLFCSKNTSIEIDINNYIPFIFNENLFEITSEIPPKSGKVTINNQLITFDSITINDDSKKIVNLIITINEKDKIYQKNNFKNINITFNIILLSEQFKPIVYDGNFLINNKYANKMKLDNLYTKFYDNEFKPSKITINNGDNKN